MARTSPKRRRRATARRVKIHRSYTIDEAARVTGACRATVRRWIKSGLPTVQGVHPFLILGADLAAFLQRATRRHACKPAECFCFKCRLPRRPALGMADYIPMTETGGNLSALCEDCVMHKRIKLTVLTGLQAELDVTIRERPKHLRERS